MRLAPHRDHRPRAITGVTADPARDGALLRVRFEVSGEVVGLRVAAGAGRTDELWRHSCCEAFVGGAGGGYHEFNFAPTGAWAAYRFDARRAGMREADAAPVIAWRGSTLTAAVAVPIAGDWRVNLTAVLEEADGTKSYWALAHPDGPPDFHDPACFVLELAAATAR